jgi:hypothetical protein
MASHLARSPAYLVYDRRERRRVRVARHAIVDALHTWQKCSLLNVSATGFSLSSSWRLPIGSKVLIYFELPRAVAVDTEAEVVRVNASGDELGFRFTNLPAEIAIALERFVDQALDDAPRSDSAPDSSAWC